MSAPHIVQQGRRSAEVQFFLLLAQYEFAAEFATQQPNPRLAVNQLPLLRQPKQPPQCGQLAVY